MITIVVIAIIVIAVAAVKQGRRTEEWRRVQWIAMEQKAKDRVTAVYDEERRNRDRFRAAIILIGIVVLGITVLTGAFN